jgi:dienelactone hydrolase
VLPPDTESDPQWDAPVIAQDDPLHKQPVNDETFRIYRSMFSYDRTDLEARVEAPDDVTELWTRQTISFRTGYGGERMSVFVFLPKAHPPPYQAVIYFPGSGALVSPTIEFVDRGFRVTILRSGRALVFPIYKGMFERGDGRNLDEHRSAKSEYRDLVIQWSKDLGRTIDYLETRPDIQHEKVGFLGFSLGGAMGFILPAVENRLKANVLISGGRRSWDVLPEIDSVNFAPRVTVPTLMLNGRFDFFFLEPGQREIFSLLGTPPEHKRHVLLDAGHVIRPELGEKEMLAWLDRYLGAVK